MSITAIIIDDEKMARALLEGILSEYCKDVTIIDTCHDLSSGVKAIRKLKPNLVFLDIEMPGHSGLELLDFFDENEVDFSVIFTTAYNQYAIQAFKLSAIDYLLKPIEPDELIESIERFKKNQVKTNYAILKENLIPTSPKKIALATLNSLKFIEIDDILFFKADGAYTHITLIDDNVIVMSKSLKKFEEMLSENRQFLRCHKSYLVNLKHVTEHVKSEGGFLKVCNKYDVALSSEKTTDLYKLMNWLLI